MMMDRVRILATWEDLKAAQTPHVAKRVGEAGNLRQYCSLGASNELAFTITSIAKPPRYSVFDSVEVAQKHVEKDDSWNLTFVLLDQKFENEFATLCVDLCNSIAGEVSETLAHLKQLAAYEDWIAFYKRTGSFGLEAARGLFGELMFIKHQLIGNHSNEAILDSWKGPEQGNQDFQFSENHAVEVKTMPVAGYEIKISSENQLVFPGKLTLAVYKVAETSETDGSTTLVNLVEELSASFTAHEKSRFLHLLAKTGYSDSNELCISRFFQVAATTFFDANAENFPKIASNTISPVVRKVKYSLSVPHLELFEIRAW